MMKWIQRSPEEAGVVVGRQMAEDSVADMLNAGVLCYAAAVGQVATVNYDHTSTGAMSLIALNKGAAKFGDRAGALVAWVMHSKSAFDIYGEALTNATRLFVFGNVRVIEDGFGRPLVVTDSANLVVEDGGGAGVDHYRALGLTPGAVLVSQNGDFTDNVETKNGNENIIRTYQAEWSYNVGVQGFAWDKTSGGHSPNDAAIGSASNWDRYSTSHKDLAGIELISQ